MLPADVIFCYLYPDVTHALSRKLRADLRPGTVVISCNFPLSGLHPESVWRPAGSPLRDPVHVYRMPRGTPEWRNQSDCAEDLCHWKGRPSAKLKALLHRAHIRREAKESLGGRHASFERSRMSEEIFNKMKKGVYYPGNHLGKREELARLEENGLVERMDGSFLCGPDSEPNYRLTRKGYRKKMGIER